MHAQATLTRNAYAAHSAAPYVRDAALAEAMEDVFESMNGGRRLVKGLLVSIGLEATVALAVYGVWMVWHISR